MKFEEILPLLKAGRKCKRSFMPEGVFIVLQKGYPDGIPCNKQTAEVWNLNEGDLFKCEPYLQMSTVNGSHVMWEPTVDAILANDWMVL